LVNAACESFFFLGRPINPVVVVGAGVAAAVAVILTKPGILCHAKLEDTQPSQFQISRDFQNNYTT